MKTIRFLILRLSIPILSLTFSTSAYSGAWLQEGFDWSLPWYASASSNGGMLDIHNSENSNQDSEVTGSIIRLLWRDLESIKGQPDFTILDNQLSAMGNNDRALIRLEVNSRCHAPDWAKTEIPASYNQNFHFWDPKYLSNLSKLINDFAAGYKNDPKIAGVHLGISDGEYYQIDDGGTVIGTECPPAGSNYEDLVDGFGRDGWGEFWWTYDGTNQASKHNEELIYEDDGLTPTNFEESVKDLVDLYTNAFGIYSGKLAWMGFSGFGSDAYRAKKAILDDYAKSKNIGNREGQIESWMRYTDNAYGVNLVDNRNDINANTCSMTFDEAFADTIQGRYWGEENEFYGNLDYIVHPDADENVGPLSNQAYRFYVSSMRALQLRRNYVSIHDVGHTHLRSINDQYEWQYTGDGSFDPSLQTQYKSGEFITYLSKTLGRVRSDTPDAFVVLGERTINATSGLYPPEYKTPNQQESCLEIANSRGYALVSDFGRWLRLVSITEPDTSMKKVLSQNNWGQILSYPRNGEHYEYYARKSKAMHFDINDQLIQERCGSTCSIQVKVVFKDEAAKPLQVVPTNGTPSTLPTTWGGGQTRTATFELNDFASGGSQPDFHIKTLDDSDLSVLMVRVNFVDNPSQISAPAIPVGIAPAPNSSVASGDVTFSWQPVTGATEYKVSYDISFSPDPDDHVYQSSNYESATSLNCASGTCSMTLPNLQVGDGKWWVRARNATGESADWSNTINFTLTNALVAPTIIGPDNNIITQASVIVTWHPTGAPQYRVSHGHDDIEDQYDGGVPKNAADFNCSSGICSETIDGLLAGPNLWWVLSKSPAGESSWSDTGDFTVVPAPDTPTVVAPKNNENITSDVTFRWWPVVGATHYRVDTENGDGSQYPDGNPYQQGNWETMSDLECGSGVCSHTIYGLQAGASKWWVTAKSSAGESASTGEYMFTVVPPATPTVISPKDYVDIAGVKFLWWPTAGAVRYKVDYDTASGYVDGTTSHADTFNCSSGKCSYIVSDLPAGAGWWRVTADSDAGPSQTTAHHFFTVVPPATPTVISPQYYVNTGSTVTVKWWPTAGALRYKVDYENDGGYHQGPTLDANTLGCGSGQCSYSLSNLAAGASKWWVTADSQAGPSVSTGANHFVVVP